MFLYKLNGKGIFRFLERIGKIYSTFQNIELKWNLFSNSKNDFPINMQTFL